MKQFKITLLFVLLVQLFTSFQTMGKPKYRIQVKTFDGVTYYFPMEYRRDGKLFKEWVYLTDDSYKSRDAALDVVNRAKLDAANYEIAKQIQYIYIK